MDAVREHLGDHVRPTPTPPRVRPRPPPAALARRLQGNYSFHGRLLLFSHPPHFPYMSHPHLAHISPAILRFMGVWFLLSRDPISLYVTPPPCPYPGNLFFSRTPSRSTSAARSPRWCSSSRGGVGRCRRRFETSTPHSTTEHSPSHPSRVRLVPFFLKIGRAHQSVPICHTRILLNCSCVSHAHSPGIYQRVPSLTFSQRVTSQCTCRASELVS